MRTLEQSTKGVQVGSIFFWCLPSLVGFVLFLFSFPIDRIIPFWPHWSIAEIFFAWFIFVVPITVVIAFVVFVKRKRAANIALLTRSLVWVTLAVSLLVNLFMLLGAWASTY